MKLFRVVESDSFGKEFYKIEFSSLERVLAIGTWILSLDFLCMFAWTNDFLPTSINITKA